MGNHRDLIVWQMAYDLAMDIYRVTATFPLEERYGLISQLRRAAVSIVSNLAEGTGRDTRGELRRYAAIAQGSTQEVACQIQIARDVGYLKSEESDQLLLRVDRIGRLLTGLMRR
jgi:four helix bundle protein